MAKNRLLQEWGRHDVKVTEMGKSFLKLKLYEKSSHDYDDTFADMIILVRIFF